MKNRILITGLLFSLGVSAHAKLTVHEWGTFTSLVGSNGQPQQGMTHEDEALPDFVHNFGDPKKASTDLGFFAHGPFPTPSPAPFPNPPRRCGKMPCDFLDGQLITQKMETPVVYFYADQAQRVSFEVSFPQGVISQSFPKESVSLPEAIPGVELKNGLARYEVNILKATSVQPPFVEDANIYSHARKVASDLIRVGGETEKFIFYRGLGEFQTELVTTSENGALSLENKGIERIPAVFLLSTDGHGRGEILSLGGVEPGQAMSVGADSIQRLQKSNRSQAAFIAKARARMLKALVREGLFRDEAEAMLATWENGYFKTPGLRVLYVLNRPEVEKILPVRVSPAPDQLNRVFVGRIEVLLDTAEDKVLAQVLKERDQFDIQTLGRMAEPILHRVEELARERGLLSEKLSATLKNLIAKVP